MTLNPENRRETDVELQVTLRGVKDTQSELDSLGERYERLLGAFRLARSEGNNLKAEGKSLREELLRHEEKIAELESQLQYERLARRINLKIARPIRLQGRRLLLS